MEEVVQKKQPWVIKPVKNSLCLNHCLENDYETKFKCQK